MHEQRSSPAGGESTQAPHPDAKAEPYPAVTALLIAIILSASRWIDWALRNTGPIVTSPRFTGAIKDAGIAAAPVLQKVIGEIWRWYTTVEHGSHTQEVATRQAVQCCTSQSLTFGVSMPGVSINMQYQASSTPLVPSTSESYIKQQDQDHSDSQYRVAVGESQSIESVPAGVQEPMPPASLLTRARGSVATVSSMPLQTLALMSLSAPLHPIRTCSYIWHATRPRMSSKAVPVN